MIQQDRKEGIFFQIKAINTGFFPHALTVKKRVKQQYRSIKKRKII